MTSDYIVREQEYQGNYYTIWAIVDEIEIDDYYYEIYDEQGFCINEGLPFYTLPTHKEVEHYIENEE